MTRTTENKENTEMNTDLRHATLGALAVLCLGIAAKAITLPSYFADGMMLQRNAVLPVAGKCRPGEAVVLEFDGRRYDAVADAQGAFRIELPPLDACATPKRMMIAAPSGSLEINDILVGDLWLCCGQSNMEFRLSQSEGGMAAAATASPQLRILDIKRATAGQMLDAGAMEWIAGGAKPENTSGVGFFFAAALQRSQNLPIGIAVAAVGSTGVAEWTLPGGGYANAMLATLRGFPMAGVVYYQGESDICEVDQYCGRLAKCIDGLKRNLTFANGPFKFILVQIAPFGYDAARAAKLPLMQCEQERFARANGYPWAVISDAGDFGNIHPTDKRTVGERLARLAEICCYQPGAGRHGTPYLEKCEADGDALLLTFAEVSTWTVKNPRLPGFEVAGEDGRYQKAAAEPLPNGQLRVRSPQIPKPQSVRYLWKAHYKAALFNEEGLPPGCFKAKLAE